MKVVMTIVGVILVLLLFSTMLGGIEAAQTDVRTDTFGAVVTAPAATTAPVVLVADLYDGSVLKVDSVTSDLGTDVPLVDSYVAATKTLTVRGLTADASRTLTVVYKYGALTGDSAAAGTFMDFLPLFIIIALVVIVVACMIAAFAHR